MTTEVLTPKNTSLWTSHIRNNSSLITQKVSTFQTNTFQNKQNVPKSYDRLPDEATFHLQSVWDRQVKKLQWSDCNPIAFFFFYKNKSAIVIILLSDTVQNIKKN